MKAEPASQHRLAEIARLDARLMQLAHRRRTLPEQARLDELTAERTSTSESAARVAIDIEDCDRAISKLESDISAVRKRRERDEQLVASGSLQARQISEVEHELGTLARRQSELEDEEIEILERREAMTENADHLAGEVGDLDGQIETATTERDEALAEVDDEHATATADRERLAAELPGDLVELYDTRRAETGVGAGLFTGGRCTACSMELDRSSVSRINAAAEDEVVQCPECSAILLRGVSTPS